MLSPTSPLVVIVLFAVAAGFLVLVVRARHLVTKIVSGAAVIAVSLFTGAVLVNDSFGYYTTWSAAYTDSFGGAQRAPAVTVDTRKPGVIDTPNGQLVTVNMPGHASHINRHGYVYLPPQYNLSRYRHIRFPVVMLLHGTPGGPWNWREQLHIAATIDSMMARRDIGPMVFVMPNISSGRAQECLNYGAVRDETYVAKDVPADISHRFRVSRDRSQWAMLGYSSGGYCAVNLALHHRRDFGAAASMDGYYWPADGPAIKRLAGDPRAQQFNNPLATVERLPPASVPLPQFWISAGSGSADDLHAASAFVGALQNLEHVDFVTQPGAAHNFYAWRDQIPGALAWLWRAIAPPSLRVEFPTGGAVSKTTVPADPRAVRKHRPVTSPPGHPASAAPPPTAPQRPRTATPPAAPRASRRQARAATRTTSRPTAT